MPYAVALFFDEPAEKSVRAIWQKLAEAGITDVLPSIGVRPHVSLAVCQELEASRFQSALAAFAAQAPTLEFELASVGTFPTTEAVVFLAPAVSPRLLALHEEFHRVFAEHAVSPSAYYLPGN